MSTRENRNSETRDQERQGTGRDATSQQSLTHRTGGDAGTERERGIQRSREGGAQSGLVRSQTPGWGLGSASGRSPFAMMRRMMEDMDRMFEDFGLTRTGGLGTGLASPLFSGLDRDLTSSLGESGLGQWSPAVEVLEKGDKLLVRAEIPGVSKDDVSIDLTDDLLTIQGERRQESEDRGEGYYRSERSYGRFVRSIPLPEGVDTDKADARFRDGVLEITLPAPKRERKQGRKLSIR